MRAPVKSGEVCTTLSVESKVSVAFAHELVHETNVNTAAAVSAAVESTVADVQVATVQHSEARVDGQNLEKASIHLRVKSADTGQSSIVSTPHRKAANALLINRI